MYAVKMEETNEQATKKKAPGKKTEFVWTDDEIQLLLEVFFELKSESEYEGVNFESKRNKYEQLQSKFCDQYPDVENENYPRSKDLDLITKERVSAKIKAIRMKFRKAVDSGKKSGGGRIIFTFYDICEKIWGGCPAVRSLPNGIDTSTPKDSSTSTPEDSAAKDRSDLGSDENLQVNETDFDKELDTDDENETGTSCSTDTSSHAKSSKSYDEKNEDDSDQEVVTMEDLRRLTTDRRKKVEQGLKTRREKKLASKLSTDTQLINLSKEELALKRKLVDKFEKSDVDFNEGLNKVLKTMDTISSAIQQSVGILAQLVNNQHPYHPPHQQMSFPNQQAFPRSVNMSQSSSNANNPLFYYPHQRLVSPPNDNIIRLNAERENERNVQNFADSEEFLNL